MSPAAMVNGDSPPPSSAFLSHLISYPVVSDSLHTLQSSPYTSKPVHLTERTYFHITEHLSNNILPLLRTPYQYVSPYLTRADSFGDSTLSSLDEKFPVIKKPTGELYNDGKSVVFFPVKKGMEGKEYVFKTYDGEVKKGGKEGIVGMGKAVVVTGLVVTSDALKWLGGLLGEKKEAAKDGVSEKMPNGVESKTKAEW